MEDTTKFVLPVIDGLVYPCAVPGAAEGPHHVVNGEEHMALLHAWNVDRVAFTVTEAGTLEAQPVTSTVVKRAKVGLAKHPCAKNLQTKGGNNEATTVALAVKQMKEKMTVVEKEKSNNGKGNGAATSAKVV